METSKNVINPKKIEQGKRLAEYNRQRQKEFKRLKEEKTRAEEEEFEKAADEFEVWKKQKEQTDTDTLTIQSNSDQLPQEEKKKGNSKMTVFLPALALTIAGIGTFWYYRERLEKPRLLKSERPKILSRLERFQK